MVILLDSYYFKGLGFLIKPYLLVSTILRFLSGKETKMNRSIYNKTNIHSDHSFVDIILSWSLEDICNEDLYKDQFTCKVLLFHMSVVEKAVMKLVYNVKYIDLSFNSFDHYFGSYIYPLLEETRAQLCSSMEILSNAPCASCAEVISLHEPKSNGKKVYAVKAQTWKNRFSNNCKELYKTMSGDVFVLTDFKPETVNDLQRAGRMWTIVLSAVISDEEIDDDNDITSTFEVIASKDIDLNEIGKNSCFLVFLKNIIPNRNIWNALHMSRESKLIEKVLCAGDLVKESCDCCPQQIDALRDVRILKSLSFELNESQYKAVCACLSSVHCNHKSSVDIICGPPGTEKTKTLGTLLFALLKMNCRTLVCASTSVALQEVASHVLRIVRESFRKSDALFCELGDMLLFGNHEQLSVDAKIEDIYLDYRVKQLENCFAPNTDWRHCFASMIDLLENCVSSYHIFIGNNTFKRKDKNPGMCRSFLEFLRERFLSIASPLRKCVYVLCTHVSRHCILEHNFDKLVCLIHSLDSLQAFLSQSNIDCELMEELFSPPERQHSSSELFFGAKCSSYKNRTECLTFLRTLKDSLGEILPNCLNQESIRDFCLRTSSLIFSSASSSFNLHSVGMEPLNVLVIDEAAQLKESESIIPLLLPEINHAIIVEDECQLPAMVESNVSYQAGFGRSLLGRLSSLGYPKHFLNIQYRMHPAISSFPNAYFYLNQILDAPNVKRKSYKKQYLPGPMFGPYSFINVVDGREEFDDARRSRKNMVEVAVVMKILRSCFKAWLDSKENLSIGIVSPYSAQVVAIKDRLGQNYNRHDGFNVNVKTIDGFQGEEHDIIILSTVRTNVNSSLGFMSNPQRTNVALTRARHCLWILGNEKILVSQENVWKSLVLDAKNRRCFFNADEDEDLAKTIWDAKIELDQLDDLLNADSVLFRNSRWKVIFSDNFLKAFKKLQSDRRKKWVIGLLLKLSGGWRPKRKKVDVLCGNSSKMLMQFKVEGLYVLCSKDIVKESSYTQVLKIWDILPLEDIPKLVKRLDNIFGSYTDDFINHCNKKCFEGNMEVPMIWEKSPMITKFKNLDISGDAAESSVCADQSIYVEDSKVKESMLLMKFYSLSPVIVSHLLSHNNGNEIELPFEVTDEEQEIILFPKSTFVMGRSGTGKTTVLIMKLFQKETLHCMAVEAAYGIKCATDPCLIEDKEYKESTTMNDRPVLRQLFVTVSSRLCQAVKHHLVRLKRSMCAGSIYAESSSAGEDTNYVDDESVLFKNISDSFVDLPATSYPLVITFQKFLMMLDGTLGDSYFGRFSSLSSYSQNLGVRSVALEIFIRNKEVTYERFDSLYWSHFNSQHTKNLDTSRIYKEIMSHIKGGIQAMEPGDGKLSRDDYLSLSENRASSLSKQKREMIYDIYQSYEKMKINKGEFDIADIVIDLHRRLRIEGYKGDEMNFVYIDEVQDLSLSQIALFKCVCQNTEEGFIFCGDTAQTIAKGIDFRFQDIKSLFYKKFVFEPKRSSYNKGKAEGKISDVFLLNHNFRTHAGVLKLSQSIIDILFHFFPYSIDVLKPETSFIHGEAPIILECGNGENAVVTIFGRSGNEGGKIVGFGAEQVILVRDDSVRKEVLDYVGKHALVLTILECKGLEFQDVLLYNFFGSSPLRNRWRVIYEYMKELDMLESTELMSYPCYNDSVHNILCSELKQLYVAITRTRQRLWIYEQREEFSRPMLDYWKKKGVIQFKGLDDSLAQSMKVASTQEEWKSSGIKLYLQHNYDMATICFERAGDFYWERKSKAASLRATAKRLRDLNPEDANAIFREAAQIFEGIGMVDTAAECFSDSGDHERAGRLYLENSDLKRAGDCFYLARCYEVAAQVYAKGSFFSDCLTVCAKGGLHDIGLDYIQQWKQHKTAAHIMFGRHDLNTTEQRFLERCAHNCLYRKDTESMMKYVRAFHSEKLMREFLRSLNLLNELLLLEKELGNYMEAVDIAVMIGDIPHAADLLGKVDKSMEATKLILSYVLANSLWYAGSEGWPLKQFTKKAELLRRALSIAKEVSSSFYELASTEVDILSNEHSDIFKIMIHLKSSRMYGSITGEILCLRKLLDAHLQMSSSKYVWQGNMFNDSVEGMILKNQLSMETLFYCWTCWKDTIVQMLQHLPSLRFQDIDEHNGYGKFLLGYFGAQKQITNPNDTYLLLVPDANWVINMDGKFPRKNRSQVSVDVNFLVSAAENNLCSELLSVGMAVLCNLKAFYEFSLNEVLSEFCQFRSLMLIYEVSKFLIESECFSHNHTYLETLEKFLRYPVDCFFCYVIPLDRRKSLTKNMIAFRATEPCQNLIKDVIYGNIRGTDRLTYGQIGRVAVLILGMAYPDKELCVEIMKRCEENSPWKEFIQSLDWNSTQVLKFYKALQFTYCVNWMEEVDYISPSCFMDLIERLLLLTSRFEGFFFATKSSFAEWLIYRDGNFLPFLNSSLIADAHEFIVNVLCELLCNPKDTENWITKSNLDMKEYFPLFVLRLVVSLCLLHLSSGKYEALLHDLLRRRHITTHLPLEFFTVLCKGRKHLGVEVFAEAFKMIGNPLVIVRLLNNFSETVCPDAISVDFKMCQQREFILQALFPNRVDFLGGKTGAVLADFPSLNCSSLLNKSAAHVVSFWGMLENLQLAVDESCLNRVLHYSKLLKDSVDPCIELLISLICGTLPQNPVRIQNRSEMREMLCLLDEMKQFSSVLSVSDSVTEKHISVTDELSKKHISDIDELSKTILSRRPKVEHALNPLFLQYSSQ